MKKTTLLLATASLLAGWIVLSSRSGGPAAMGVGNKTGSPLSSGTCSDCHSGGSYAPSISAQVVDGSGTAITSYTPGQQYTLNVTVSSSLNTPAGFGFQGVMLNASNAQAGAFGTPTTSNTQVTPLSGVEYVEHNGTSSTGIFSIPWTAPSAGTGDITFYYEGVAVNGMGNSSGDNVTSPASLTLTEQIAPPACNNPTNLTITGLTATSVTLSWQSGGDDTWDVELLPSGNAPNNGGWFIAGTPSKAVTGLQPGTSYDYYVRENCDSVAPLMITGVFDGPLTGGHPKVIELYVNSYIPDLSIYGLGSANNGGGSDGEEFSFPSASVAAGTFIYVTSSAADFLTYFGFAADYENGSATAINGDDAVELFMNGSVIDVFGDINTDGTGQPWEYLDGWAYRNNNQINNYGVFNSANWSYSSPNAVDGCTDNTTCSSVFPAGTFSNNPNVSSWVGPYTFSTPCISATVSVTESIINTCTGSSNGSISLSVNGGITPYSYQWNNMETTAIISGLSPGTFTYTVSDFCGNTASNTVSITNIAPISITPSVSHVSCNGMSDGAISLSITGGQMPAYSWSNGQTSNSITGVSSGVYSVTISDMCETLSSSYTITEPTAISVTTSSTDNLCASNMNGTASVTVSGGTAPYNYLWSNGATTSNITGLSNGVYTASITDSNNCTSSLSLTISSPPPLTISNIAISNATTIGGTDGSINITVTGGVVPYMYSWNTGASTSSLTGLSAGTYNVTVTDNNSCNISQNISVGEPGNCNVSYTASTQDVSCNGMANGSITVTPVTPSVPPYTYSWNTGATTDILTGISGGVYTVTVSDGNLCESVINFTINEPIAISISTSVNDVSVPNGNDGSINVTVTGGLTPYAYTWSNGATISNIAGLTEGVYVLTVTDNNNCTQQSAVTVSSPPCDLSITLTATDASNSNTSDGTATVYASGTGTPYSYMWNNGNTTQMITGLSAGTYSATVTDTYGCIATGSISVNAGTVNIQEFPEDIITLYPNPASASIMVSNIPPQAIIEIDDLRGRKLTTIRPANSNHIIDIGNYEKGIYLVKVKTEENLRVIKLIKQ